MKVTQKDVAAFYGLNRDTLRRWGKGTDGELRRVEALRDYYIKHTEASTAKSGWYSIRIPSGLVFQWADGGEDLECYKAMLKRFYADRGFVNFTPTIERLEDFGIKKYNLNACDDCTSIINEMANLYGRGYDCDDT